MKAEVDKGRARRLKGMDRKGMQRNAPDEQV